MSSFGQDLRYATRTLVNSKGFTAVAVLTLAIGVGANVAIFSFVDGILLKPLPYEQPERIVRVLEKPPQGERNGISTMNFLDWQKDNTVFDFMSAQTGGNVTMTGGTEPIQLRGARVSAGYFKVFGITPALGRTFLPDEDQLGKHQVAIISHALWAEPVRRRRRHREPDGPVRRPAPHDRRRPARGQRLRPRGSPGLASARVPALEHDEGLPLADLVCPPEGRGVDRAGAGQHERDWRADRARLPGLEQGLGRDRGELRRHARRPGHAHRADGAHVRHRLRAPDRLRESRQPGAGARCLPRAGSRRPRLARRRPVAVDSTVPHRERRPLVVWRRARDRRRLRDDERDQAGAAGVRLRA